MLAARAIDRIFAPGTRISRIDMQRLGTIVHDNAPNDASPCTHRRSDFRVLVVGSLHEHLTERPVASDPLTRRAEQHRQPALERAHALDLGSEPDGG